MNIQYLKIKWNEFSKQIAAAICETSSASLLNGIKLKNVNKAEKYIYSNFTLWNTNSCA